MGRAEGDDVYLLAVSAPRGDGAEYVSHATCLARAAHPEVRLPLRTTELLEQAPPNWLDGKPRTSEGR